MNAEVIDHQRQTTETDWVAQAGARVRMRPDCAEIVAFLVRKLLSNNESSHKPMMPSPGNDEGVKFMIAYERALSARLLGAVGREAAVEPLLEILALDDSSLVQVAVAQTLVAIGQPAGEYLLARCESLDPARQAFVLRVLREIMHSSAVHQPAFLWLCDCVAHEALAVALANAASEAVCVRAGEVLGYFGLDAETMKTLEQLAGEPSLVQRITLATLNYPGPKDGPDVAMTRAESLAQQREIFVALIERVLALMENSVTAFDPPDLTSETDWRAWSRYSWRIARGKPLHANPAAATDGQPPEPGQRLTFTRVEGQNVKP